ncbi:uncharacterized protein LOC144125042 [Amblyomma americanum]
MSREVELERPARVEQRERVVPQRSKQPSQGPGDDDVVLEKEEQCVCQICTCGQHRCGSASLESSAYDLQGVLQRRACAGCEKEAGRRQWEVSPDRVRQISKSYRSIERQDDASETTTISEQRLSRQERTSESKVFHSGAIASGAAAVDHETRGQSRQRAADDLEYGQAVMSEDATATHIVRTSEFAAHESDERMRSEASCHRHSASLQADGDLAQGRVSSRYRPKTSLRLEGPQEYTTTSSEYFSTIDQNLVARAEQYKTERQAASGSRHYPLTRPQTSLRTGGKTHYSTTTAEDFKLHEQAEKVTRRLRPRRFDDPSYDTAHADVEGDVKKRRTEADHAAEDHVTTEDVQDRAERTAAQDDSYGGLLRAGELVSSEAQTQEQSYLEPEHEHRVAAIADEAREERELLHSQVVEGTEPAGHPLATMTSEAYFHPEVSVPFYPKDNLEVPSGEMDLRTTHEMEFYKKKMDRVRPVKPKSLAKLFGSNGSSSEGDLHAASSHLVGKSSKLQQKERVEHTYAAGLASNCDDLKMHLGINNVLMKHKSKGPMKAHFEDDSFKWDGPLSYSTTTKEAYEKPETSRERVAAAAPPHRVGKGSRLQQKERVEHAYAAGLASDCDDLKMHLGINNVLMKHKSKDPMKAHFEDDSFKWDGPLSYSTTTKEAYKKPETSRGRVAAAAPPHRVGKGSRLQQKERVEHTYAAGLASDCDDFKMHLGINNVLMKHKSKGQRKAHFEDDSFKWDGPLSYSTTTNDSYKKPESSHGRVAACRRPQSHDVLHRFTQTGDELRRIKGKKKDTDEITMFGRKDSTELIAEIQGLLGARDSRRSEHKAAKQGASVRKKAGLGTTPRKERAEQAVQADSWPGYQQEAQERPRGQQKVKGARKDGTYKARFAGQEEPFVNGERVAILEKRGDEEMSVEQHRNELREVAEISTGQQEYLDSSATARKYESTHQKQAQTKDDVHKSEEVIVEGNEAQGYFDQGALSSEAHHLAKENAERPIVSRLETSHISGADQNKFYFSTTTADSFKNVSKRIQPPKPFYPKPNLAPEGSMSFETVHHGEFTPKTVVEVPTPVRPVSTLKLSDDTSYAVRNEDKIGYSRAPPAVGETRFSIRKPESTLVLGQDSVDYKTTSQIEYKAHEIHEMEDIYKKSVKVKRDRHKTYTRGQPAVAASAVPGMQKQRQRSSSGIVEMTTTTRAAFKPVTVERPQPYRPQSSLKVRSSEDSYAEISTTMRDTFRRVTPTARVKPIKREASLKKLGDDTDYAPRKTTTSEAYREVKIPPKPEPYRPVDNLKVTGRMTFSTTTQESYVSRSSLQHHASEFVERAKPIKRDAVAKDIIFPVDSSDALTQGAADYAMARRTEESTEVLRSLENTSAYARISKAPRERPRTHQKVGRGAFEHTTTSMAEYQDPRTRSWKQRSTATGRLVRTASAECPAAFLNTDKSEYVFKEVIGNHRFYLPAVQ